MNKEQLAKTKQNLELDRQELERIMNQNPNTRLRRKIMDQITAINNEVNKLSAKERQIDADRGIPNQSNKRKTFWCSTIIMWTRCWIWTQCTIRPSRKSGGTRISSGSMSIFWIRASSITRSVRHFINTWISSI